MGLVARSYAGDVADLCLTFTIGEDVAGESREIPLVRGGEDLEVTNQNRMQYIYMAADAHLNASIKRQADAFRRGLSDLIPAGWLAMFSEPELQVLISGSAGGIDVADLRANTVYVMRRSSVHSAAGLV